MTNEQLYTKWRLEWVGMWMRYSKIIKKNMHIENKPDAMCFENVCSIQTISIGNLAKKKLLYLFDERIALNSMSVSFQHGLYFRLLLLYKHIGYVDVSRLYKQTESNDIFIYIINDSNEPCVYIHIYCSLCMYNYYSVCSVFACYWAGIGFI